MPTNPFEDTEARYLAVVNDEGQYALWPGHLEVPAGWHTRFGPEARQTVLDHIEETWTDMRPLSLIGAVNS
ncbi:MbtH family protein [Streptomyces sp. NPDC001922]|uniref:MbtH family protein n=1 Tax=unclassified Streptomyces TaxID=2593676 RepID=UPI0033332B98